MDKKVKIGLLGLGTVGSGVVKTLNNFKNIEIKSIAVKNLNKKRNIDGLSESSLTDDIQSIVNDDEIEVVVEVIGGITPAYELIKKAIQNKKHIVTANKELVAKHGKELFSLAKENNVVILYEAAVAGGIPIIMPVKTALSANNINKILGILNGTTNYILTKMEKEGTEFDLVVKEAQELGYAEADPTGDVEGYDAAYKIAILSSIAFNKRIDVNKVYREGIEKITPVDIKYANEFGYKIKLIAQACNNIEDRVDVRVHPALVPTTHPIAHIDDVLNAIVLEGFPVGQVMISGPGAGEFPTASSVVADILALAAELAHTAHPLPMMRCKHESNADYISIEETKNKYYLRINVINSPGVIGELGNICGKHNINLSKLIQKDAFDDGTARIVLLTEKSLEKDMKNAINEIKQMSSTKELYNVLRVIN